MTSAQTEWFDVPQPALAADVLHVDVDGYEGPLDLLLDLARRQKVDLAGISVLSLARQYLAFIDRVREGRIEVAADYLVMAAWLAYLKSRLMVPQAADDDEPSGEMLAAMLQFRLQRLEAMRGAAARLMARSRLGIHIFGRGAPEPLEIARRSIWDASLYDVLKAYSSQRERGIATDYAPFVRKVWSLQDARDILQRLIGDSADWVSLDAYLAQYLASPADRATVRASTFASSLELVRQGEIDMRQGQTFGPLLVRRRQRDET
ncbi:segregation and condensation protein A [Devosia chinhatensis]|uniref:Segregation and condensation protein A n=1 Tax=Devosia chinhatensis TaxID=429727 RepID=A0A0F5FLJ8_9HYPH|nr:ScpA family protein [Devosia chinhatensis]KKB09445.1 chromosome segregation protein ScpA [Devosia chinhatensis]